MADKRVRRLDQRAYRLWRLAQRLRDHSGRTVELEPEDDWFDTVTFDTLTVTCRPTVPLDPDECWLFAVHYNADADADRENRDSGGVEIEADTLNSSGGVQIRGGNVEAAAQQIISMAATNTAETTNETTKKPEPAMA